jgi:hypothetical protein
MDNKEAVKVIRSNWPDERYSMLREALELSIKLLEAEEPAQLSHNSGSTKSLCLTCKSCDVCDSRNYIQTKILACKRYRAQ